MARQVRRPAVRRLNTRAALLGQIGEAEFERWIIRTARRLGWSGFHIRMSMAVLQGVNKGDAYGWPDWVFARRDRLIFRELKSDTGRMSAEQRAWAQRLLDAGQDVDVWRPKDEARILAELT